MEAFPWPPILELLALRLVPGAFPPTPPPGRLEVVLERAGEGRFKAEPEAEGRDVEGDDAPAAALPPVNVRPGVLGFAPLAVLLLLPPLPLWPALPVVVADDDDDPPPPLLAVVVVVVVVVVVAGEVMAIPPPRANTEAVGVVVVVAVEEEEESVVLDAVAADDDDDALALLLPLLLLCVRVRVGGCGCESSCVFAAADDNVPSASPSSPPAPPPPPPPPPVSWVRFDNEADGTTIRSLSSAIRSNNRLITAAF